MSQPEPLLFMELTILMPCLNEAETLGICINKARKFLEKNQVAGEVLIADNGSTDGSREIAQALGARVVHVSERGYGAALITGIDAAQGRYIIMGDSDDSYDFTSLMPFVEKLRQGYELVMGNRFQGGIQERAMPPLHRYLGNPVLSFIGRLFFRSRIGDFHCGLRGFNKKSIQQLGLQTPGMEFASEMVVKATLRGLRVTEVPTKLHPDGRSRPPHLNSWRDGWRHLRFLLLFSPRWLFLHPGLVLLVSGLLLQAILFFKPVMVGPLVLDIHTMLVGAMASIVGMQMIWIGIFSKVVAIQKGLLPVDHRLYKILAFLTVERGSLAGLALCVIGVTLLLFSATEWAQTGFHALDPRVTMRYMIPSVTTIVTGVELIIASFFLGVLSLRSHASGILINNG
jgi:glycosyltransferase involved in cell wall biosynthesis